MKELMTRLQKKCVIATAGFHLLLVVILFLGPAFFWRKPAPDDLPILKVIPLTAVDAAMSSGVASPKPPPPQPQPQPTPPTPTPAPPQPVVVPQVPVTEPVRPVETKPEETPTPDEQPSDTPSPLPPPKHKINPDLTPVVSHAPHQRTQKPATDPAEERAERAAERRRAAALRNLARSLADNLSDSTEVEAPGVGAASYANYGQIVTSIYHQAWTLPDNADSDLASPRVHVVIARDGSVISAEIIQRSGDASVDDSVQRAIERVKFIRPFPDGSTDTERSYNINFNLKAKRKLG